MKRLAVILTLLLPTQALALDGIFYTYNGFEETVAAFTRLALIFSDDRYLVFVGIIAVLGVTVGALVAGYKGVSGGGGENPVAFFIPILLGLAIFRGLLIPTGNLTVHDPVRGAVQTVPDVPDLIVFMASTLSKIEQAMVDITETASLYSYSDTAGSLNYSLLRSALNSDLNDVYLERSISRYYLDCGLPALGQSTGNGWEQHLRHETEDMFQDFANWTNGVLHTVYYPPNNDAGEPRSCTQAWSGSQGLAERLSDPNTFTDHIRSACVQSGFNAADAAQLTKCKTELANTVALFGVTPGTEVPFLRSLILAQGISDTLNSADFSRAQRALVDRQVMAEGMGTAQAMDQWIPKVRAFMTATMLGLVPLLCLFIVTPLLKPSLVLLWGLFLWLTLWGICDVVAMSMAFDAAADAFDQIRAQKLGLEAILHAPEAAVKAMGVFGKSRMVAITLATVLAGALFKFGGYAFARLGEQWQSHLEQAGESAGRQTLHPEETAALQRSLMGAMTPGAMLANGGFTQAAFAEAKPGLTAMAASKPYVDGNFFSGSAAQRVLDQGYTQGTSELGDLSGIYKTAAERGESIGEIAHDSAEYRSSVQHFGNVTRAEFAEEINGSVFKSVEMQVGTAEGDVAARKEVYENLRGEGADIDAPGLQQMGRVSNADLIAETRVRDDDGLIKSAEQRALQDEARTDAIAASGKASQLGRTDALQAIPQSDAKMATYNEVGMDGLRDAHTLEQARWAGAGRAAGQYGDVMDTGLNIGTTQTSRDIAASENLRLLADLNGMNSQDIQDLVTIDRQSNGEVSMIVRADQVPQFVEQAVEAGGMRESTAISLLASGEGYKATYSYAAGPDGPEIVNATYQQGDRIIVDDLDMNQTGYRNLITHEDRQTDVDSRISVREDQLQVDASVLEPGRLEGYIPRLFQNNDILNGDFNDAAAFSFFQSISSATGDIDIRSSDISQEIGSIGATGQLGAGSNQMGASLGGELRALSQTSGEVLGGTAAYLRDKFDETYRDEITQNYRSQMGEDNWARAVDNGEAQRLVANDYSQAVRSEIESIRERGSDELRSEYARNEALNPPDILDRIESEGLGAVAQEKYEEASETVSAGLQQAKDYVGDLFDRK